MLSDRNFSKGMECYKARAALDFGCSQTWELAEWFNLPEQFIVKVWNYYSANGMLE